MSLSSLIVQHAVATMRQVEEALARQVLYGGDLTTNLLEVAHVDEGALTRVLSKTLGLSPVPAGPLPIASEPARFIAAEVAVSRGVVPIGHGDRRLIVAVEQPLPREVATDITIRLGVAVEQRAALAVRVREAIARAYGVPLDRRMEGLVARLAGQPVPLVPLASTRPPAVSVVSVPASAALPSVPPGWRDTGTPPLGSLAARPVAPGPPAPPLGVGLVRRRTITAFPAATGSSPPAAPLPSMARSSPSAPTPPSALGPRGGWIATPQPPPMTPSDAERRTESEPPPTPVIGGARSVGLLQREVPAAARAARRRRGPLTFEAAKKEAAGAGDRDTLLYLFFDFARQFFEYTALFLVHGDIAEGFDAFGAGAGSDRVVGVGVPLDLPSMFSRVREERTPLVACAAPDALDAVLLADLQRPRDVEVAVVPLCVRTRAVAILLGDCGEAGVDPAGVEQVSALARAVARSLERVIVRRKLEAHPAGAKKASTARNRTSAADERSAHAAQSDLGEGSLASLASEASDASAAAPPARFHSMPAASANSWMPPPPANAAAVRAFSGPPIPREDPESSPDGGRSGGVLAAAAAVDAHGQRLAEPVAEDAIPKELDARALFDMLGWETGSEPPEPIPPSSSFALPPHRPPPPSRTSASGSELPSVIVDLDHEIATMLERVISEGDESAEAELLRQGDRAMRVIRERFPGPVNVARERLLSTPLPPRASECGPLLRLVARERKVALPFVLDWMADDDPETRGWATHLVCELAYVEAIPHVLDRLRDPDACTRASARLAIAAIARSSPETVTHALEPLVNSAEPADRVAGVRGLAALHQAGVVPQLVTALGDSDERVVDAAHDALVEVTAQDFGAEAAAWQAWWQAHGEQHRVEWLIDSLTHPSVELRRAAGEELRLLARDPFGYESEAPARDRERAQERFREWWQTEGRSRLRRR